MDTISAIETPQQIDARITELLAFIEDRTKYAIEAAEQGFKFTANDLIYAAEVAQSKLSGLYELRESAYQQASQNN